MNTLLGHVKFASYTFPIMHSEKLNRPYIRTLGVFEPVDDVLDDVILAELHGRTDTISNCIYSQTDYIEPNYPGSKYVQYYSNYSPSLEDHRRGWSIVPTDIDQVVCTVSIRDNIAQLLPPLLIPLQQLQDAIQSLREWLKQNPPSSISTKTHKAKQTHIDKIYLQRDARYLLSPPHVEQLREQLDMLLQETPSSSLWMKILQHLAMWPDELEIENVLVYIAEQLSHWDEKLREVPPLHWFALGWLGLDDKRLELCLEWNISKDMDSAIITSPLYQLQQVFENIQLPNLRSFQAKHIYYNTSTMLQGLIKNKSMHRLSALSLHSVDVFKEHFHDVINSRLMENIMDFELIDNELERQEIDALLRQIPRLQVKTLNVRGSVLKEDQDYFLSQLARDVEVIF